MAKSLIMLLLILTMFVGRALVNPTNAQSSYKLSGYVLDTNGNPLNGAVITLNNDNINPVLTNNFGYFEVYASPSTYQVSVYPPFDSNYIFYNQPGIVLNSNIQQNFTLNSGYKIFGFIKDEFGAVIPQARFALVGSSTYVPGWYSNMSGYYFATAPLGTYTLTADPRTGIWFNSYSEPNIVLNGNIAKNITVSTQAATPSPTPTTQPTVNPTPQPTVNPVIPTTHPAPTKTPAPTSDPTTRIPQPSSTQNVPELSLTMILPVMLATAVCLLLFRKHQKGSVR